MFAALLLTSCSTVTFGSRFNEDGSASHQLTVVIQRSSILAGDLSRVERELATAEQLAREDGFAVDRLDDPTRLGLRVTSTTRDSVGSGPALNNLFNSILSGADDTPVAPFQGTFERESGAVGGTSYDLDLTVDGEVLYRAVREIASGNRELGSPETVSEVVTFQYVVTMPGEVTETDGLRAGDAQVHWEIPVAGITEINARSTVGKRSPWLWIVVTILLSLLVFASLGYGMSKLLLRRHLRASSAGIGSHPGHLSHWTPPATLSDVGSRLRLVTTRIAAGFPLHGSHRVQQQDEDGRDGADTERD